MTLGEFLAARLGRILLFFAGGAAGALFLAATGTQTGVLLLLALVILPAFLGVQASDFLRQRNRIRELEEILEGLDQAYLFSECASPARDPFERRLMHLTGRACRAMTGAVSQARSAQRAYQEYVERWVHEIKTPITAAGLLCRRLDAEARRSLAYELGQIEAHVERALFCARAESPEQDCLLRRTSLEVLTAQALADHRTLLTWSGVRVETGDLDQPVFTDAKWAVFLLGQLLQNAARYRGRDPVVELSARRLGKRVQLPVRDNGIGIPAHELPRVFDRGFTGSNGRARGGSTGMGLYLCRRIAAFLDLGLDLQSREGRGTCVTLTFPTQEILQNCKQSQ